jgi:PAS domain S-box-containing protein
MSSADVMRHRSIKSPAVLIVDDDPGTRETLSDVLKLHGYAVESAPSGRAALERLSVHPARAVIVDIELPDVSGLELLGSVKASPPSPEVILITGHASLASAIEAINGAAFAYLTKPFEVDHLLLTLARALEKQQQMEHLRRSAQYRVMSDSLTDAVFLLDSAGWIVLANPRAAELTGHRDADLSGRPIASLLAPESRESTLARLSAPEAARAVPPPFGTRLVGRDGRTIAVEAHVTTAFEHGQPVGRLMLVRGHQGRRPDDRVGAPAAVRILVTNRHPIVQRGVKEIVADTFPSIILGGAQDAQETLELLRKQLWDLVVLDVAMPDRNWLDVLKEIKQERPKLPVLILDIHSEEQLAVRAMRAGAAGYLTQDAPPEELTNAIRTTLAGRKYVTRSVAEQLAIAMDATTRGVPHQTLSDREYSVVRLIASGKTSREIADELSLSIKTISTYRVRALEKMGLRTNAELMRYAIHHGLVT